MNNSQPTSDERREHRVNPDTDRCVMCGRNAFNRKHTPYCDYKRPPNKHATSSKVDHEQ